MEMDNFQGEWGADPRGDAGTKGIITCSCWVLMCLRMDIMGRITGRRVLSTYNIQVPMLGGAGA
jgi:hypothetical protein